MSKKGRVCLKILLAAVLSAGLFQTGAGNAFDRLEGEAVTVLNVRKSPRVDSKIIGWLDRGQRINIKDREGEWYRIVFKAPGKRYAHGWVHSRYITVFPRETPDISSALAEVKAEIKAEEMGERTPPAESGDKDIPPPKVEKERGESHVQTGSPAAGKGGGPARLKDEKGAVVPHTEKIGEAEAHPRPTPVETEAKSSSTPAAASKADGYSGALARGVVPLAGKPERHEQAASYEAKAEPGIGGFGELARLALRLLSVLLSCVAILFSYKAIKLARISYNTSMELQKSFQIRRQQEDLPLG